MIDITKTDRRLTMKQTIEIHFANDKVFQFKGLYSGDPIEGYQFSLAKDYYYVYLDSNKNKKYLIFEKGMVAERVIYWGSEVELYLAGYVIKVSPSLVCCEEIFDYD